MKKIYLLLFLITQVFVSSTQDFTVSTSTGITPDNGSNFSDVGLAADWYSVTISTSGKYQLTGSLDGKVYSSSDFGDTFIETGNTGTWRSIKIDSN